MNLNNEDRNWLDEKFGKVHSRITASQQEQTQELHRLTAEQNEKIHQLGQALEIHKATACPDVKAHEAGHHPDGRCKDTARHEEVHHAIGWPKTVGIWVAILGAVCGIIALGVQILG
jgi:hypothetical protein